MTKAKDDSGEGARFTVKDRRSFDESGERRPDAPTEPAPGDASPEPSDANGTRAAGATGVRYPVDFRMLLARFSIEALIHLGVEPNPETRSRDVNLDAARVPIDLLTLIEDKTRGNLDDEEARELQDVLYQLRMLYVERSSDAKS